MIINMDRNPSLSLYYLGSFILQLLLKENKQTLEELYTSTQIDIGFDIHIDFFYYTLDWLFILSTIKLKDGRVCLCELKD
jgi:hypothetical protein